MTENSSISAKNIVEITPMISDEVLDLLVSVVKQAKSQHESIVTPFRFLQFLVKNKNNRSGLEAGLKLLSGNLDSLQEALRQTIDLKPNRKYRGVVFLDPEIKKALLLAGALGEPVDLAKFLVGLFLSASLKDLVLHLQLNLTPLITTLNQKFLAQPQAQGFTASTQLTKNLREELERKEIFGRREEALAVLRILTRQKKNNLILVGDSGVGKKAVVLSALKRIQIDPALESLRQTNFLSVDLQTLTAAGEEKNLGQVLEAEINAKEPAVVVLENVEVFKSKEQVSILSNFLYHLQRSTQARFILPVSPVYLAQFLQSDPIINQNFEKISVPELGFEEIIKVLSAVKESVEKFHKVKINESLFPDLISLSKRFIKGEALPQKAISLLEEAAADAAIGAGTEVTKESILSLLSQKTGVPLSSLNTSEKEKMVHLEEDISRQVIGQAEAVRVVSEAIRRSRAGLKDPKKPIGSFLFLGSTGVGKTELAKALAKMVFDSEKAFVRLDMSEYGEPHTTQRLIGSPPGYVGYEEGGQLTNPVQERPYCLILLDEIEKAHPKVFDVFLQVLDDGRLTDAQGRLADFKNTIIIATSNLAQDEILEFESKYQSIQSVILNPSSVILSETKDLDSSGRIPQNDDDGVVDKKVFFEQKIMPKLKESFRPEFINRFDEIIVFKALTKEDLKKIAQIKLKEVADRILEKGIALKIKEETLNNLVASSYDLKFGARPLVRKIREEVENEIAHKIIEGNVKEGDTVEI